MARNGATKVDCGFVEKCVRAYYGRAPRSLRLGIARPQVPPPESRVQPPDESWPLTVPADMREGRRGKDGWVAWQPLFPESTRFNPFEPHAGPEDPHLKAFLTHVRLCRPLIRTKAISFFLANTPTHAPTSGMHRLKTEWWDSLWDHGYVPVGETEDGSQIVCLDDNHPDLNGEGRVVLCPAEPSFRLFGQADKKLPFRPTPLFPSFRALLEECLLHNDYPWAGDERAVTRVLAKDSGLAPFDWRPLLLTEPAANKLARDPKGAEPSAEELDAHLERLARKVEALRRADPACLILGAERHQYRMNPKLLPEELRRFETSEKCRLPVAYRQLLLRLGNGGFGAEEGLCRLEYSRSGLFGDVVDARGSDKQHLRRDFPHRRAWAPPRPVMDEDDPEQVAAIEEYYSVRQIDGMVFLGGEDPILLVVNGPERGHIWRDLRGVPAGPGILDVMSGAPGSRDRSHPGPGIHPLVRRGPYSLLAWLEGAADYLLAHIDGLYTGLPNREKADYVRAANEAFGFHRLPLT
jgi:hypothetical protein